MKSMLSNRTLHSVKFASALLITSMMFTVAGAGEANDAAEIEFFEKKIRPVLVQHCYRCHAADAMNIRGGLQLDTRAGIRQGGESGPAVVPQDVDASLIVSALKHDTFEMPPDRKLPKSIVQDFEKWIAMGAHDPREGTVKKREAGIDLEAGRKFWAFQPLASTEVPDVKNKAWSRTDIDRFILAKLESQDISPATDATREVLIRRAYFDLIGLPPTPEQIDAFVDDKRLDAFEHVVDQLLDSPHFGERWGRHWLDVARFAESSGGGRTQLFPNAWRYRDYVIRAFNSDKPYDQFISEQVAGDLMPSVSHIDRAEKLTALGFLTLGPTNYELQDKELLRMEVIDEQIDTIGRAVLGLTIGCARCHDHKFDPIPTRDYYALAGIFRSTKTLTPGNVAGWVKRELPLPPGQEQALANYLKELKPLEVELSEKKAELEEVEIAIDPNRKRNFKAKSPVIVKSSALSGVVIDDVAAVFTGDWIRSTSIPQYVDEGYRHNPNEGATATFKTKLPAGLYEVRLAYSAMSNRASNASVSIEHGDGTTEVVVDQRRRGPIGGLWKSLGRYRFSDDKPATIKLSVIAPDGTVIADAVQFLPLSQQEVVAKSKPTKPHVDENLEATRQQLKSAVVTLQRTIASLKKDAPPSRATVMGVEEEAETGDYHICIRGNAHVLGDQVPRGFLQVLPVADTPKIAADASGRLELAQWLTSAENPLAARVMANRIWHHLLGSGLVRTPDTFGVVGERPTHPQLLDHLASEFVDDGWSMKRAIRRVMLSRVYRLSSHSGDVARKLDPENKLLSHANRRRMSAEAIRDAMLMVSGQLDDRLFGSGMKLGTRSELEYRFVTKRRSIYVPCFRNTVLDMFTVFDMADTNLVTGKRNVSAVPTQALLMLNSPFVMEQAERFADRLIAATSNDDTLRVRTAYRWAVGREPTERELELATTYVNEVRSRGDNSGDAERTAWSGLCHSLYASLDFRYVD